MKLIEFKQLLDQTGYPVAYFQFKTTESTPAPSPPFLVYYTPSTSNFKADNKVYSKITNITVELYTNYKNLAIEQTLESLFEANDLAWEADEVWIESEQLFQRIYDIGVI
ncbi:hypothetical protein [Cytobacillus firmus]|uniref:hypothetical protein n=1 Tax=Cytobacillus firmus TaxID=1399 RepID=UPI001CFE6958|nr:hypothetical protein [Cytobacillus firmus]